jgi:hypothetical protein
MEFSPDEDIRSVLTKLATKARPKANGSTLSRRAEIRVGPNAVYNIYPPLNPGAGQTESQAGEVEGETKENEGEESNCQGQEGNENG